MARDWGGTAPPPPQDCQLEKGESEKPTGGCPRSPQPSVARFRLNASVEEILDREERSV